MAMLGGSCSKCCDTDTCCSYDVQSVGFLLGEKILSGDLVPDSIYTGLSLTGTYNSGPIRYSLNSPPWSFFREDGEYLSVFSADWFLFERKNLGCPVLRDSPSRSIILPGVPYEDILPPELLGNNNGQIPRKNSLVVLEVTRNGFVVKPFGAVPINRPGIITTELTSVKFGGVTVTGGDIASRGDRWFAGFFPASKCPFSAAECNYDFPFDENFLPVVRPPGGTSTEAIVYYRHDEYVENAEFKGPLEIEFDIYDNYTGLGKIGSGVNVLDWPDLFSIQNCPPCEGACCETDGTCNIKPQCECDTDNGAVFAGVGATCEACPKCPEQDQWPSYVLMDCDTVFTERVPGTYPEQCLDAIEQYFSPSGLTLQLQSVSETGRTATYSFSGLSSLQSPYGEHNHYPGFPDIPYQAGFTATVKISCGENPTSRPYTEFFLSGSQYFVECDQTVGQSGLSGGVRTFVSSTHTVRSLDLITLFIQGDENFIETSSGAAPGFATGSVWQPAASWSPISPWPWQPNIQFPGSWFETPSGNVHFDASQTFVVSCNPLP